MTLFEFFEKTEARRHLVANLKANMHAFDVPKDDRDALLRVNLTMIRQAMEDEGVE